MRDTLDSFGLVEKILRGKTSLAKARTKSQQHTGTILLGVRELHRRYIEERRKVSNLNRRIRELEGKLMPPLTPSLTTTKSNGLTMTDPTVSPTGEVLPLLLERVDQMLKNMSILMDRILSAVE